jgi:glycosyltransferase involved in cell wall biosynthesis
MRVVIARRVPGSTYSMEVYADNLIAGLKAVRPNWEVEEIAPIPWSRSGKLWQSGIGLRKYYETFWQHPKAVSKLDADVFHIIDQSDGHIANWLKKQGKSVVITCHDLVQFVYPEILLNQSRIPAISMAMWRYSVEGMKRADHIVTVSDHTAKDVNKFLNIEPQKITTVPNGLEAQYRLLDAQTKKVLKKRFTTSPEKFHLLNVGSTHQRKNILTVLKVLKNLKDRDFPVCLWRTGGRFTIEQQNFIKKHSLESGIIDLGHPDKETLVQIYNAADVLVAPSLYEGFGLTIIEAMACGLPVITSNVSSLPEVSGDAAILVNPIDTNEISNAVIKLVEEPSYRQNFVRKGLSRSQNFTWVKSAQKIASIYERAFPGFA